jgi:hypothetical protein
MLSVNANGCNYSSRNKHENLYYYLSVYRRRPQCIVVHGSAGRGSPTLLPNTGGSPTLLPNATARPRTPSFDGALLPSMTLLASRPPAALLSILDSSFLPCPPLSQWKVVCTAPWIRHPVPRRGSATQYRIVDGGPPNLAVRGLR